MLTSALPTLLRGSAHLFAVICIHASLPWLHPHKADHLLCIHTPTSRQMHESGPAKSGFLLSLHELKMLYLAKGSNQDSLSLSNFLSLLLSHGYMKAHFMNIL